MENTEKHKLPSKIKFNVYVYMWTCIYWCTCRCCLHALLTYLSNAYIHIYTQIFPLKSALLVP